MMVLLVWFHLLAAIAWIGGMLFLSVVLVPVLRCEPFASQKAVLFRAIAGRFRAVVWGAIAVLLFTGPLLLHQRGIPITDPSAWPTVLVAMLGLVALLLLLTLLHDFILGPRVLQIAQIHTDSRTRFEHSLVLWSPWVARFSFILALAVLFTAVVLVRT
ncbi:MAG TPA: CopD family protein [Nitrospiraceae bacterium]|nr:CopD family protein [Nitrospiraceae bacterium]